MTVRSFAQNFEDVLLWRALKHVGNGRYVDVGAGHPTYHSVTKLFYDAGWSGINVEPLPALAAALEAARPRDVNVHAAVTSADVQTINLTVVDQWDELSTIDGSRADELRSQGRAVSTTTVAAVRLDGLLAEHDGPEVHFLKIDVEGAELDVLTSLDLRRTRPWITLLEVVAGGTEADLRAAIREHLEERDYVYAYFDGLNDYFVAAEHADELLPHFSRPVNVTDDFVAVSDTDEVAVDLIAEKLGMPLPAQSAEVMQRVEALLRDRIEFETRLRPLEATEEERLAEHALRDALQAEVAVLGESVRRQEDELRRLRMKNEALEQTSFDRERMVAWYASEVSNYRNRWQEQRGIIEDHVSQEEALQAIVQDTNTRLNEVLESTSWRSTLPMRVIRRPRIYLRKLTRG